METSLIVRKYYLYKIMNWRYERSLYNRLLSSFFFSDNLSGFPLARTICAGVQMPYNFKCIDLFLRFSLCSINRSLSHLGVCLMLQAPHAKQNSVHHSFYATYSFVAMTHQTMITFCRCKKGSTRKGVRYSQKQLMHQRFQQ